MNIFNNMFKILTGKANEIDKPIFTKPFVDKANDMVALAMRLDSVPEESKDIYRDSMQSLAAKIKAHQAVRDLLANSEFPVLILYDLHLLCPAGSAVIDYVVLSNRFVAVVSCLTQNNSLSPEESRAAGGPGEQGQISSSEHAAYILTELLKEERLLNKKDLQMIWPLTILADGSEEIYAEHSGAFSSVYSQTFPEIHKSQNITIENFIPKIKQLFQFDDAFSWLTNREVFDISSKLISYDESTKCSTDVLKG